jgi:hypothetical protein
MGEGFISGGFGGRRRSEDAALPPGQYLVEGFPVLSAGPTPHTPLEEWDLALRPESIRFLNAREKGPVLLA